MHWGHVVSCDLVSWENRGIALFPSKTSDRSGCFSGSAVEKDGKMYLFYTGVNYSEENPENINVAVRSKETGMEFTSAQMLLISPDGENFDNFNDKKTVIYPIKDKNIGSEENTRDPKVWRGEDAWYMVLGSTDGSAGRLLIYKSDDLENWTFLSHAEKAGLGRIWECPDYFKADGTGILIFSPMNIMNDGKEYDSAAVCAKAEFDEVSGRMDISENIQMFDYGLDLYAPQSTTDENGSRVVIAWARMPEAVDGKWNGMMCIPRIVEVQDGHIFFRPHPNVEKRFAKRINSPSEASDSGYMVKCELHNGESINIGGYVIKRERDIIYTDRSAVFTGKSNFRLTAETPTISCGYDVEIFVDNNLIEVYINGGEYVISSVVYGISKNIGGDEYELFTIEGGGESEKI